MFDRIKALSQQTLLYGAGHILARMVTFLLLPLYTNAFSPAEYGVVSLAYTFMGFMSVVLHYGLDAALMRYYVPADQSERKRLLTTAYLSFIITSAGFALFLFLVRGVASDLLLGGHYPRYLAYIAAILALDILWSVPMLLLRSEGRPLTFILFNLLNVISSLSLNLLLVVKYQMGVEGVLLSNLLTSGGLVLITAPLVVKRTRGGVVSWATWKRLMRFGLPFLPSGVFAMLMELADRYILKTLADMETVGLYSAGYKLGMLMMLLVMGFNMGWQPFFLKEGDGEEKRQMYSRIATYVLTVLGFFWVLLLLWVDSLVRLRIGPVTVYGPEYWSSTRIVPLIALGYIFFAAYSLQLPGVFLREQSRWIALTRGFGAALNIGANLILIPYFGALGAAAATCLSFFLMAVMIYVINRNLFPVSYEWTRLTRIAGWILIVYFLSTVGDHTWGWNLGLTALYPLGLIATGFLKPGELRVVKSMFGKIFGR